MPFFINPFGNNNSYPNVDSMQNTDIKTLDVRINNLEREILNLKNRINKLENMNNHSSNYSSNYQANSYNMM